MGALKTPAQGRMDRVKAGEVGRTRPRTFSTVRLYVRDPGALYCLAARRADTLGQDRCAEHQVLFIELIFFIASRASKPIASAKPKNSTTSTRLWPLSTVATKGVDAISPVRLPTTDCRLARWHSRERPPRAEGMTRQKRDSASARCPCSKIRSAGKG